MRVFASNVVRTIYSDIVRWPTRICSFEYCSLTGPGGIQFQLSFTMLAFVGCQFNSGPLIYQLIACCIIPHLKNYRKIPKISLEAYIFERPFLRGLFLEGLIFGGAYIRREICVSKPIGPAL